MHANLFHSGNRTTFRTTFRATSRAVTPLRTSHRRGRVRAAAIVGVAACAAAAPAQLVLTSDQRVVSVDVAGAVGVGFATPAWSPFSRDLDRNGSNSAGTATGRAVQDSTVSAGALQASGRAFSRITPTGPGCISAQASSDFRIIFRVNGPVSAALSGSVSAAQFRLVDSLSGPVAVAESAATLPFSFDLVLRPGRTYTLLSLASNLSSSCVGVAQSAESLFSLAGTFTTLAPCPGDLNYDRLVDNTDFTIFVTFYNELFCPPPPALCEADINGDSVVDNIDFVSFVEAYNAFLCP